SSPGSFGSAGRRASSGDSRFARSRRARFAHDRLAASLGCRGRVFVCSLLTPATRNGQAGGDHSHSRQSTHDTNALRLIGSSPHFSFGREFGHEQYSSESCAHSLPSHKRPTFLSSSGSFATSFR